MFKTLQTSLDDIDEVWNDEIWPKVLKCGEIVKTDITPPRRCSKQTIRANVPGDSREYFKVVIGIPVLNIIISDLRDRFGEGQLMISKMLVLNPKNLLDMDIARIRESLEQVVQHFDNFFTDKGSTLFAELAVLKQHLQTNKVKFSKGSFDIGLMKLQRNQYILVLFLINKFILFIFHLPYVNLSDYIIN